MKRINFNSRKFLLISTAAVVIVTAAGYLYYRNRNSVNPVPPATTGANNVDTNLAPATAEEKQEAADNKDRIIQQQQQAQQQTNNPSTGKKTVTVIVTGTTGTVNAYVQGVIEDGGTCTATFTQGSQVVTATSTGFANVSVTNCPPITPPAATTSGSWNVVVSYSSTTSTGASASAKLGG